MGTSPFFAFACTFEPKDRVIDPSRWESEGSTNDDGSIESR
jgi:hypothetical protein